MRIARLGFLYLRLGALNELQYRVNFFVAAFQSLLSVGVGLIVLALVYSHTATLNGWTESELLVIPRATHYVVAEFPRELTGGIARFLARAVELG